MKIIYEKDGYVYYSLEKDMEGEKIVCEETIMALAQLTCFLPSK